MELRSLFSFGQSGPGIRESLTEFGRSALYYLSVRGRMAAAEARAELRSRKSAIVLFAAAGVLALFAAFALMIALMAWLGSLVGSFAGGAAIVGATLAVAAVVLGFSGARAKSTTPLFENLKSELKQDIACLKKP